MWGEQLEQPPLERGDIRRRQSGPRSGAQHRLEAPAGRQEPLGEVGVDRLGVDAHSSADRARSVASSRFSAASTASVCSGCSPPCSAAAAASATGSRCSASSSSRRETPSDARQPSSSASAASSASEQLERGLAPAALVEVEPRARSAKLLAGERDVAAREQDRGQPLLGRQQHRALLASAAAARSPPPSRRRRPARRSRSRRASPAPAPRSPRRRSGSRRRQPVPVRSRG